MSDVYLILKSFFERVRTEETQKVLKNVGIQTVYENGEIKDTFLILKEVIIVLNLLLESNNHTMAYHIVISVVGEYYSNSFIQIFLNKDGYYEKIDEVMSNTLLGTWNKFKDSFKGVFK